MFDIKLMKSKFYTKSKSAITATKTRITRIKRKRKAMQKYLKNDIADLLKNGLDLNAYGRVEGLWNELNLSSCYEFVEQFCTQISTHLTNMDKQRDCPDVCREAVSSLMLAAARFSDHLPELRGLGNVFLQRFGTSLDHYVNKEFNNKIKSMTPPTKDMKLQVMQEIAKQSGVEWNAKNLEQKLFNPPPPAIIVKDRNNPNMIDAVQNTDKKEADYDEARKKGYLYKDGRTELSRDERVVVPKVESFGGCNKNQEGSSPPAKDNNNQDHKPSNLRRTSSGEEEEEEVVDMEPFYYKTIRLPSYKSNLKQDTNLIQQCDDSITEHTVTRPKPKSVRTRNQKASPAASVIISVTRKSESVLEAFLQQTDRSNEGVRFEKDGVKNGPPTRRASLPAESLSS